MLFRETGGDMRHTLLVTALMHLQVAGVFLQRLPKTEHVAVPENGHYAFYKRLLLPVDFNVLLV